MMFHAIKDIIYNIIVGAIIAAIILFVSFWLYAIVHFVIKYW
jgi:hypothetical protein